MRTTITIDDELLAKAKRFTRITSTSALVRQAITQLIQLEAGRRLAAMGGTDPTAWAAPRRRAAVGK
jgi:Arc/MetJ family transcription regulator